MMMKSLSTALFALVATPAFAASGPFFSLNNTNFVVLISFVLFIAVLLRLKVPGIVAGILDKRADAIRADLDEARSLREEAQTILASYERKQKEVAEHAEQIVIHAKEDRIETIVGDGKKGDGPDGIPLSCRLARPHGVFVDKQGNVYIGDSSNNRVRKLIRK